MLTDIKQCARIINNSGVILYPTDTIWGLGGDATNNKTIEQINIIKQRPQNKSYIILINSIKMLEKYVTNIPDIAIQLIETTTNPLTIIYNQGRNLPVQTMASDGSIAIRIIKHPFCNALIDYLQKPIISSSANISSHTTPLTFNTISDTIKQQVDYIVDIKYDINLTPIPSTIIKLTDFNNYEIIRS